MDQFPSNNSAEAADSSQRKGNSSSQPRRKSLTKKRRQILSIYIQMANETPMKHGKVGSLQWTNKVLQEVNHGVGKAKDRVTNIDLIWWLKKHFKIKVEDMSRSLHIRTRSQSREPAVSSVEVETAVQNDVASHPPSSSSSAGVSSDENPTSLVVTVAEIENSEVGRERKARAATPQGSSENVSEPVALTQVKQELLDDALGVVFNFLKRDVETETTLVVSENVQGQAGIAPESAAIAQGAAANVEALATDVRPATGTTENSAAPSPEVMDLDNEGNEDESNESRHANENARDQSPSVGIPAGSGTHGAGESVRPVVDTPPESPVGVAHVAGLGEVFENWQKEINPGIQKLMIQMAELELQIKVLQEYERYPPEQMEVLLAQARAMKGMINLLTRL